VPGGVADPAESRIFVPGEQGGIDALERATGRLLWHSDAARLPLLGLNGALLAAAYDGAVLPCLLDAQDGQRLDSAFAAIATPPGHEWWVTSTRLVDRELVVGWRTVQPQPARAPSIFHEGIVRIKLDDGTVSEDSADAPTTEPVVGDGEILRDAKGQPSVWPVGDRICALAVPAANPTSSLDLLCWAKRGKPKSNRLLRDLPKPGYLQHHPSPDADHVFLLLCNDRDEDGKPAGSICNWLIFSAPDGGKVLTLSNRPGLQPRLAIVGDLLFYIESGIIPAKRQLPLRMLQALSVPSGAPVWAHPLPQQPAERLA
jgi:hypothetical protein